MNYDMVRADVKRFPVKPVVNGEARYEKEAGTKPLDIRHSAYWSYLAGGFYSYGHEGNWRYQRTWREWINSPGALQIIQATFFRVTNTMNIMAANIAVTKSKIA